MAAVGVLAFLIERHMADAERKDVEEARADGLLGMKPVLDVPPVNNPEGLLRYTKRIRAEAAIIAALARACAATPRPVARALDRAQWVTFELVALLGHEHEVDWAAGRWRQFERIEVEAAPGERTDAERDAQILAELERRAKAGELVVGLRKQAAELYQWAHDSELHPPAVDQLENIIREPFRQHGGRLSRGGRPRRQ